TRPGERGRRSPRFLQTGRASELSGTAIQERCGNLRQDDQLKIKTWRATNLSAYSLAYSSMGTLLSRARAWARSWHTLDSVTPSSSAISRSGFSSKYDRETTSRSRV